MQSRSTADIPHSPFSSPSACSRLVPYWPAGKYVNWNTRVGIARVGPNQTLRRVVPHLDVRIAVEHIVNGAVAPIPTPETRLPY